MSFSFTRADFPSDFVFGAATAAYQIEGSSHGNCGSSHWDTYAATPGNVVGADNGSVACDHYHRMNQDLDLVRDGGFDAYRFSTSWARVMPDGHNISIDGLDFYDELTDGILSRGLRPNLTLYHWDLPSALADIGGWANREIALRFGTFTEAVMGRIGDRIDMVATINEPWCIAWLSHFLGLQAPGLRDIRAAARAMHHVLLAHGVSLEVLRVANKNDAGIVLNLAQPESATQSELDVLAARTLDAIHNRWFLDALFLGQYPDEMLVPLAPYMPIGFENDMERIAKPIDWLGINYYTRSIVAAAPHEPWPSIAPVEGPLQKTAMDWEIYPQGLLTLLKRVRSEYSGQLPLFVTENGMAGDEALENRSCDDPQRVAFLEDHLQAVKLAIEADVPVMGYFVWSLLDNFEWSYGYEKRFGLVHVDYETQRRTPKSSYRAFQEALSAPVPA